MHDWDAPLVVETVYVAEPAPGEILVRAVAAGLCHSDVSVIEGKRKELGKPIVLGHELAGVVDRVGFGVTNVEVGDRVVACASAFCGRCEWCVKGRPYRCLHKARTRAGGEPPRICSDTGEAIMGFVGIGGFAEFALMSAEAVTRLPNGVPPDVAAVMGCAVVTGLGAVFNTAKVQGGDSVAVIGCGGIGLNALQAAALSNAREVIAVDTRPQKLDLARSFGATRVVDASTCDAVEAVRALTGDGVDHAIEAVGTASTIRQAFDMLRAGGTATVIGMTADVDVTIPATAFLSEKRLQGSLMGSNRFVLDIPWYADLYRRGTLKLDQMISEHVALENINRAIGDLARAEGARHIVVFDDAAERYGWLPGGRT